MRNQITVLPAPGPAKWLFRVGEVPGWPVIQPRYEVTIRISGMTLPDWHSYWEVVLQQDGKGIRCSAVLDHQQGNRYEFRGVDFGTWQPEGGLLVDSEAPADRGYELTLAPVEIGQHGEVRSALSLTQEGGGE